MGNGNFDNFDLWSGVSRSLFDDKLEVKLYNYWSPNYFGETGNNDVIEFGYAWTFGKVGHVTPKFARNFGHQWGESIGDRDLGGRQLLRTWPVDSAVNERR